ncbi:phage shock envelope stress response protein PspM [Krasilnikovia sp. MM14-A1259]|uniref:phage shock envelope stress response protein PspM n=1 Tax=Krasilnikovia sp. MM14-A1259 TaxID=3373539 RepID=UPI0037FC097B
MADERARYFRRLRRLRNSARRWSVIGGGLVAATAVLTPYAGIGLPDAFWAAAAGSSVALASWRWRDHKALAALPAPPPPDPALAGQRLVAAVERFPAGRTVVQEVRRQRSRYALRGSAVAQAWDRLDRAAGTLTGLAGRLTGPGETAVLEAAVAERWLRDLGQRVASVERAIPLSPADQRPALAGSHESLAEQFTEGVTAYERLVAAAAGYVAEDGQPVVDERHPTLTRLIEATDRMRGVAEGLSELRRRPAV